MKLVRILFMVLCVSATGGCNTNDGNSHAEYADKSSSGSPVIQNTEKIYPISCDSCLRLLVMSANIDKELKTEHLIKDGINDGKLFVKIYTEAHPEPGVVFDAADGWLSIDLKNNQLYMMDVADDSLIPVECDTALLKHYIQHCVDASNR